MPALPCGYRFMNDIIGKLYDVLQTRKSADSGGSYVASLYGKGAGTIGDKVREEVEELIAESLNLELNPDEPKIREALKNESADLLFHMLVMLSHHDVRPDEVLGILEKRFGTSGHAEKAARDNQG